VSSGLPNVFFRALGKELICRVLKKKRSEKKTLDKEGSLSSVKKNTRQRRYLPSVFLTLGKEPFLPSVFLTLGKDPLCRVQKKKHSVKKISNQNLKP